MKSTGPRQDDDKALGHLRQSNMKVIACIILHMQIIKICEFCMVWPMILLLIRLSLFTSACLPIAESMALIKTLFCCVCPIIYREQMSIKKTNRFTVDINFVTTEGSLTNNYVTTYIHQ